MKDIETKAAEILERSEVVMLASVDGEGHPRPVPMARMKSEGITSIWFATGTTSEKTSHFVANPKAGVCFYEGNDSVVLTGMVEVVEDLEVKKELWQDWLVEHFPKGVIDPEYCILQFNSEKATFWIDREFVKQAVK